MGVCMHTSTCIQSVCYSIMAKIVNLTRQKNLLLVQTEFLFPIVQEEARGHMVHVGLFVTNQVVFGESPSSNPFRYIQGHTGHAQEPSCLLQLFEPANMTTY